MKNLIVFSKLSVAFMIFLLVSTSMCAQQVSKLKTGGGGGFNVGYGYMDVSKLHNFVPANIGKFSNEHLLMGGNGFGIIGNFVIGGGGTGIMGDLIKSDSINYSISGGLGTFDFGYLIYNKEKIKIYPMLGIGGGGFGLQISRNNNVSVKNLVNDPAREINISIGGFIFDFSINMNLSPVLNYNEKDNSYGGFMTGLKAGYLYSLPSSDWTYTGGDITGGPDFGLNMVYVKLIIGGFGYQDGK